MKHTWQCVYWQQILQQSTYRWCATAVGKGHVQTILQGFSSWFGCELSSCVCSHSCPDWQVTVINSAAIHGLCILWRKSTQCNCSLRVTPQCWSISKLSGEKVRNHGKKGCILTKRHQLNFICSCLLKPWENCVTMVKTVGPSLHLKEAKLNFIYSLYIHAYWNHESM